MPGIERHGNLGYAALAPEATPGAAAIPSKFTLLTEDNMTTSPNLQDQSAAYGSKSEVYAVIPGQRDHKGDITIIGEPNTATFLVDSLLTRGSVTGAGPYTWPFSHSGNSKTYTLDASLGNIVKRFIGCVTTKLAPSWNKNELQLKATISALASFQGAKIASVSGSGPYTINLDTTYSDQPAKGLVVGDLIRLYDPVAQTTLDATIATIDAALQFVTTSTAVTGGYTTGVLHLRPQTAALNTLQSFLWSNTRFHFGATATAALAAAQTQVEQGSNWELVHNVNNDSGEQRSGSADPTSLVRTTVNCGLTIKRFFDTAEDLMAMNLQSKTAVVINHYAGAPVAGVFPYNLQIVFNHLKTDDPMPKIKPKEVNYSNIKYRPQEDRTDGVMFSVTVKSGIATIA
jgi:hypothetical protein